MMVRPKIDWGAINRILDEPSENFDHLARLAGLNPSRDFVGMDLRGVDFGRCDLSAYNFDRADLDGANLSSIVREPRNLTWARNVRTARLPTSSYEPPDGDTEGFFQAAEAYDVGPAFALAEEATPFGHETRNDLPSPPPGWTWIDGTWLDLHRKPLSDDDLIGFFDGRIPSWQMALSERVPRRAVVSEAEGRLQAGATEPGRPTVVLLRGAGGEGKSTAFRQTVVQLLEKNPVWHVLWRDNDRQPLATDWVASLPDDDRPILIATDEADNIGRSLLAVVEKISRGDHNRFHFLLAARDTDWRGSRPEDAKWHELSNFQPLWLRGIKQVDAERIYDAWAGAGKRGLGRLDNMTRGNAIRRLVAAPSVKGRDHTEGSLLRIVFELRQGEGFRDHVRKLLTRLKELRVPGGSLYDSFAYIAAMHAEGLLFLSPPVLAKMLGCTEGDLRRQVMVPLADEACGSVQGGFIHTRHRAIAKAAMELMEEEGEDRWSLITELAEQAVRMNYAGTHVPHFSGWIFEIADRLVEREEYARASILLEKLLTIVPQDLSPLIRLVRIYQKTGNTEKAEQIFRDVAGSILAGVVRDNSQRVFFREWATAAGNAGDYALDAWLTGVSVSDWQDLPRLDAEQVKLSLASLGVACKELIAENCEAFFMKAQGAAGQLGLQLGNLNDNDKKCFERHKDDAKTVGVKDMSMQQAVRAIEAAVQRAFELCSDAEEVVELGVPYPPDEFGFSSLREFVLSEQRRARH